MLTEELRWEVDFYRQGDRGTPEATFTLYDIWIPSQAIWLALM